jgi:hypothetical protein
VNSIQEGLTGNSDYLRSGAHFALGDAETFLLNYSGVDGDWF